MTAKDHNIMKDYALRHDSSLLVRASRRSLLGVALVLGACDDGDATEQAPMDDDEAAAPADEAAAGLEFGLGDAGPEVAEAHAYLRRFGYFPNPELAAQFPGWAPVVDVEPEDDDLFDLPLEEALEKLQDGYGLPVTGRLDAPTRALMRLPRCAHPDHYAPPPAAMPVAAAVDEEPSADGPLVPGDLQSAPAEHSEYKLFPNSLTITDLRYGIGSYSTDTSNKIQRQELIAAMSTWSAVAPVVFTSRATHDVTFNFVQGNLDAAAYANDSPPNCDQNPGVFSCKANIDFNDKSFVWGYGNGNTVNDIQTHALHQIGHALGLDHSSDSNAVMYGAFAPGLVRRSLAPDDINGISALYPTFRDLRIYDPQWYLELNPDLAFAIQNNQKTGSIHWLKHGRGEQRRGTPAFDVGYYMTANPGVALTLAGNYAEAFWHWREKGLPAGLRSSPAFDAKYYLNKWPELKTHLGETNYSLAMVHWLVHGIGEGRRASVEFDPVYYLQNNPDVANLHGLTNWRAGLVHWLTIGRAQGRKGAL